MRKSLLPSVVKVKANRLSLDISADFEALSQYSRLLEILQLNEMISWNHP